LAENKDKESKESRPAHEEKSKGIKIRVPKIHGIGTSFWKITTCVLLIALLVLAYQYSINGGTAVPGQGTLTAASAGQKAIDYINQNLVQSGSATLVKSVEENGVFNVTTAYQGSDISIYVSKDGNLMFLYGPLDISQPVTKTTATPTTVAQSAKQAVPDVKLFTMAFCPYGNQAEDGLFPVMRLLGSSVNFAPHYVIYSNYGSGYPDYCLDSNNTYCSMHGIQELHQDVRELCVFKYDKAKYLNFVDAVNANCTAQNADTCWEVQATAAGIDTAKIKTCQSSEAVSLLSNEVALNQQLGVQGSPMLFVNGVQYNGGRDPASYQTGVCGGFITQPTSCSATITGASTAGSTATGGCG
jgi:hypothetical protein